jgi:TonB family protein
MNPDKVPPFSTEPAQEDTNDESYILRTRLHELVPALGVEPPPPSSEPIAPFAYKGRTRNYRLPIMIAAAAILLAVASLFAWRERQRTPELLAKGKQLLDQVIQPLQPSRQEPAPAAAPVVKQVSIRRHHERRLPQEPLNVTHAATVQDEAPSAVESSNTVGTLTSVGLWDREHPTLVMAPVSPMRMRIAPHESPAYLLRRVSPAYPAAARESKVQGTVVLRAAINKYGMVENLQPVSGKELLVRAAMEAVRKWQYRPYWVEGVPQPFETLIVVDFSLAEATPDVPAVRNPIGVHDD